MIDCFYLQILLVQYLSRGIISSQVIVAVIGEYTFIEKEKCYKN